MLLVPVPWQLMLSRGDCLFNLLGKVSLKDVIMCAQHLYPAEIQVQADQSPHVIR